MSPHTGGSEVHPEVTGGRLYRTLPGSQKELDNKDYAGGEGGRREVPDKKSSSKGKGTWGVLPDLVRSQRGITGTGSGGSSLLPVQKPLGGHRHHPIEWSGRRHSRTPTDLPGGGLEGESTRLHSEWIRVGRGERCAILQSPVVTPSCTGTRRVPTVVHPSTKDT